MKKNNLLRILVIITVCLLFFPKTANALTTSDQEYVDCKANCDKNASSNSNAYSACMSPCNALLDSRKDQDKNHSETLKEQLTASDLDFCASTAIIWQIVGWVFLALKILIPLILIIFGVLDISKAVMASKDDEITKSAKTFGVRIISAIIVFFIPTIVGLVMGLIVDFANSGAKSDYLVCQTCVLNPSKCDTSKDVGKQ